ncbi:MAG TPA: hypothetical protein VM101_12920 [Flavitalea sp.]|nr:hypothetical protein [Flavitalea sp.]
MIFSNLYTTFYRDFLSYTYNFSTNRSMKQFNNKWLLVFIITVGTVINMFKGSEARNKWVFKIKNRFEEKKQLAEHKKLARSGGVLLDDIELASFHK